MTAYQWVTLACLIVIVLLWCRLQYYKSLSKAWEQEAEERQFDAELARDREVGALQ